MRICPFVVAVAGASLAHPVVQGAVIIESIDQTLRARVEATDAGGTTVVERVTTNTTVAPLETAVFARIPHGGYHDHSYAGVTMQMTLGGGSILEANIQLNAEHYLGEPHDGLALRAFAEVMTVVYIVNTSPSVFFGPGGTYTPGGSSTGEGTHGSLSVGINLVGENGELLHAGVDENGLLPAGRYRVLMHTSLTVFPDEDRPYWTGVSARSRHFIIFVPAPGAASATLAGLGMLAFRRRR